MHACKRVEIIIEAGQLSAVIAAAEKASVTGYTVLRNVEGSGHRGRRGGDQPTDALGNVMVIVACSEAEALALGESIRHTLKRFGGICLISDTMKIKET